MPSTSERNQWYLTEIIEFCVKYSEFVRIYWNVLILVKSLKCRLISSEFVMKSSKFGIKSLKNWAKSSEFYVKSKTSSHKIDYWINLLAFSKNSTIVVEFLPKPSAPFPKSPHLFAPKSKARWKVQKEIANCWIELENYVYFLSTIIGFESVLLVLT